MEKKDMIENLTKIYTENIINKVPLIESIINNIKSGNDVDVTLIHHIDMDGYGVRMIWMYLEKLYPNLTVKYIGEGRQVKYETLASIDITSSDYIIIGDLSIEEEALKNSFIQGCFGMYILLDHHVSAEYLNKYDFACVIPHDVDKGIITSGALLMFHAFRELFTTNDNHLDNYQMLKRYIQYIAAYDTYFFKKHPEISNEVFDNIPDSMNILFKNSADNIVLCNEIIEKISNITILDYYGILNNNENFVFTDKQIVLLTILEGQRDDDIERARKQMKIEQIGCYKVAVYYYNGKYVSEIGNTICTENSDIDYMLMINMNKQSCSLRTVKDIDLVEILLKDIPGAGGHPQACGFKFTKDINVLDIMREYLVNDNTELKVEQSEINAIQEIPEVIDEDFVEDTIDIICAQLREQGMRVCSIIDKSIDTIQKIQSPTLILYIQYMDFNNNMYARNFDTGIPLEKIQKYNINIQDILHYINKIDRIIKDLED